MVRHVYSVVDLPDKLHATRAFKAPRVVDDFRANFFPVSYFLAAKCKRAY